MTVHIESYGVFIAKLNGFAQRYIDHAGNDCRNFAPLDFRIGRKGTNTIIPDHNTGTVHFVYCRAIGILDMDIRNCIVGNLIDLSEYFCREGVGQNHDKFCSRSRLRIGAAIYRSNSIGGAIVHIDLIPRIACGKCIRTGVIDRMQSCGNGKRFCNRNTAFRVELFSALALHQTKLIDGFYIFIKPVILLNIVKGAAGIIVALSEMMQIVCFRRKYRHREHRDHHDDA